MDDELGPATERLSPAVVEGWGGTVGVFFDGCLQARWPFDPATSAALGLNDCHGRPAVSAFVDRRGDLDVVFEVNITAVAGTVRREVLGTRVPDLRQILALVQMLIDENEEQEQHDSGDRDT